MINRVNSKIKTLQIGAAVGVALAVISACSSSGPGARTAVRNVFVIVMENKSADQALSGPYTTTLAGTYGVARNYRAITHPSVPNYLALTSGQTWGVTDDSYHLLPSQDLGTQLTRAGVPWGAYMEGLGPAGCFDSPLPYDPGHNPFVFYGGGCPPNVVPLTVLEGDMAQSVSRLYWITPDRCHDTHDCPVAAGDDWLRQTVPLIISSKAWQDGGVLFIVWDEDDGSADNRVLCLVITKKAVHRVSNVAYNHYSLLATIEDILGVGRLGKAAGALPMNDLLAS